MVPRVHGADYFARLLEVIGATRPGDRIFFTDWRGDADERMTEDGPTVGELLRVGGARGVEVRALLWRSHPGRLNSEENDHLGAVINESGGEALLDERVRRGGSHHQKLFVVRRKGRPEEDVAFVGGIDLCHGRRDDAEPRAAIPRRRRWTSGTATPAVARRDGRDPRPGGAPTCSTPSPSAGTTPRRSTTATRTGRVIHRLARMPRHPEPLPERWDPPPEAGRTRCRSCAPIRRKRPAYPFAPQGERTIARAYARAFARARRLIYVEDQYFWSDVVAAHARRRPAPRARTST